jgi:membrane associated rhomboid family serine protease
MTTPDHHPLETILRLCAAEAPHPWYPSVFAQTAGVPRDSLDPHLDRLRLGEFIQLTEWVEGRGQGYVLTPAGQRLLESPKLLVRARNGDLPQRPGGTHAAPSGPGTFSAWERGEAARSALLGYAPPYVTTALIALNVAVFLAGLALAWHEGIPAKLYVGGETGEVLRQIGAISAADVYLRQQWWRLLTCCFVHIGLIHLGVNMYSLFVVGPLLERMWGSWNFLVLYLIAGVGGSCAMLWDSPIVGVGAGASGALWGVLASMVTWIFFNRKVLPPSLIADWRRQLLIVFGINLAITFSIPAISKGAHFGGGVVGLIAAVPLDYLRFGRRSERVLAVIALVAIPVACIGWLQSSFEKNAEPIKHFEARREATDFARTYWPAIGSAVNRAQTFYNRQLVPLLKQDADERDAEAVRNVEAELPAVVRNLEGVGRRVRQARPYLSQPVEDARKLSTDFLQAWAQLLDLAQTGLKKGEDWSRPEKRALGEQVQKVDRLEERLVRFFSGRAEEP